MQVQAKQYIFPPRPKDAIPRDQTQILGDMGWLAQLKFNDTRCLIKLLPNGESELWSRHAEKIRSYTCPEWLQDQIKELRDQLGLDRNKYHLLDGGLLDQKHRAIKDTIVIWDILVRDSKHLLGTTYQERYQSILAPEDVPWYWSQHGMHRLGTSYTPNIFHPEYHPATIWPDLWEMIDTINKEYKNICGPLLEGLVFKNPQGILGMGITEKNNSNWLMRSRVTTGRHTF
ncbi:hypothetical protein DRQ50_11745 [bacterium]|nr:MAG: hypothetical protein DRQ50_11745 [bacterium]